MADEQDALALPPTGPDGALLHVDFRITVFHIGKVDTREQTSLVRMGIVLYWTDPRMVGWSSPILPPTLWGPELWLRNAMGGVSVELEQFVVFNAEEGRLKRRDLGDCWKKQAARGKDQAHILRGLARIVDLRNQRLAELQRREEEGG